MLILLTSHKTERDDRSQTKNGTEWDEKGTIEKKEREQNDLAEGPCSRTERNDFKKVKTMPYVFYRINKEEDIVVFLLLTSCPFNRRQQFKSSIFEQKNKDKINI